MFAINWSSPHQYQRQKLWSSGKTLGSRLECRGSDPRPIQCKMEVVSKPCQVNDRWCLVIFLDVSNDWLPIVCWEVKKNNNHIMECIDLSITQVEDYSYTNCPPSLIIGISWFGLPSNWHTSSVAKKSYWTKTLVTLVFVCLFVYLILTQHSYTKTHFNITLVTEHLDEYFIKQFFYNFLFSISGIFCKIFKICIVF
jgi:hypothetical protein